MAFQPARGKSNDSSLRFRKEGKKERGLCVAFAEFQVDRETDNKSNRKTSIHAHSWSLILPSYVTRCVTK